MEIHQNPSTLFYVLHFTVSALAILLTAKVIKGFQISGFFSAFLAALVIEIGNYFLWPVFIFLTLPINLITLGLFTFVVNGFILKIASWFVPGFQIDGMWSAIFGSIILTILGSVLHFFVI